MTAWILAISVALTALSLGGVAHAQESDTGLGGTADDRGPGGLDPTRLLLPAGLLLIVVGAGLGLRQAAARSRR